MYASYASAFNMLTEFCAKDYFNSWAIKALLALSVTLIVLFEILMCVKTVLCTRNLFTKIMSNQHSKQLSCQ